MFELRPNVVISIDGGDFIASFENTSYIKSILHIGPKSLQVPYLTVLCFSIYGHFSVDLCYV